MPRIGSVTEGIQVYGAGAFSNGFVLVPLSMTLTPSYTSNVPLQQLTLTVAVSGLISGHEPVGNVIITDSFNNYTANASFSIASPSIVFTIANTASLNPLDVGTHNWTARFYEDNYYNTVSNTTSIVLSKQADTIATTTNYSTVIAGQSVTITNTLGNLNGSVAPTGTVSFYVDGSLVGTNTVFSSGVTTLSSGALSQGTHSIYTTYSGDSIYLSNSASGSPVSVTAAAASVSYFTPGTYSLTTPGSISTASIIGMGAGGVAGIYGGGGGGGGCGYINGLQVNPSNTYTVVVGAPTVAASSWVANNSTQQYEYPYTGTGGNTTFSNTTYTFMNCRGGNTGCYSMTYGSLVYGKGGGGGGAGFGSSANSYGKGGSGDMHKGGDGGTVIFGASIASYSSSTNAASGANGGYGAYTSTVCANGANSNYGSGAGGASIAACTAATSYSFSSHPYGGGGAGASPYGNTVALTTITYGGRPTGQGQNPNFRSYPGQPSASYYSFTVTNLANNSLTIKCTSTANLSIGDNVHLPLYDVQSVFDYRQNTGSCGFSSSPGGAGTGYTLASIASVINSTAFTVDKYPNVNSSLTSTTAFFLPNTVYRGTYNDPLGWGAGGTQSYGGPGYFRIVYYTGAAFPGTNVSRSIAGI